MVKATSTTNAAKKKPSITLVKSKPVKKRKAS
jgi:hypothetical protein